MNSPTTTRNPWLDSTEATTEPAQLDMSPTAILERDRMIADAVRRGVIKPGFAMSCRLAVAAGITAGVVRHEPSQPAQEVVSPAQDEAMQEAPLPGPIVTGTPFIPTPRHSPLSGARHSKQKPDNLQNHQNMKTTPKNSKTTPYLTAKPPAALVGEVAKSRWKTTIQCLTAENRKIPKSNEAILIGFCSSFQLLADCETSLATDGLLVDGGRDGKRRSPALSGKLQALTAIRNFADALGMTPSSAGRLPLPPIEDEENEWAEFM